MVASRNAAHVCWYARGRQNWQTKLTEGRGQRWWNEDGRLQRQNCPNKLHSSLSLSFTHSDAMVDGTWYLFPIFMLHAQVACPVLPWKEGTGLSSQPALLESTRSELDSSNRSSRGWVGVNRRYIHHGLIPTRYCCLLGTPDCPFFLILPCFYTLLPGTCGRQIGWAGALAS